MSERLLAVLTRLLIGLFFLVPSTQIFGQDEPHEPSDPHHESVEEHATDSGHDEHADEEFNATEYILDHVSDSHEWHLLTKKDGHHVSVPLPVILYSKNSGFHVFMSSKIAHGHRHHGFQMGHGTIEVVDKNGETVKAEFITFGDFYKKISF